MSRERDDEDIGHDQQDEESEPGFGLLDAFMAENRQPDDEGLAEHREEDRIGEPRRLGDHIVDTDPRQHGLHPAPAHEDDNIGRDRQEAALGTEGTAGDGHGRQARTGADVADEREHDGADDRPEDDDDDCCGEVDAGDEQSSGQQGRDDEVRGQPDHEDPSPAQGPADDSGIVAGFQSLFQTAVPVHCATSSAPGLLSAALGPAADEPSAESGTVERCSWMAMSSPSPRRRKTIDSRSR